MLKKSTGSYTVGNFLKVAAVKYRDREAVFCSSTGRRYTFAELNNRTNRLANGLLDLGLKKGDVAAFLCTNRSEIVEIYFALAKIGVMGVPLNYRLAPAEMIELIAHGEAAALIFDPWFGEIAAGIKDALPQVKIFVGMGEKVPDFATDYEKLLAGSSPAEPEVEINEEDYQYMNLTSGTTGLPKSYLLTHYNNASAIPLFASALDITERDVILTAFPAFGRVGFAWIFMGIFKGARNVIHQFNPQETLKLIQSEKVTISNWVPTMAAFILAMPGVEEHDLGSLRGLVFAAAPLTSNLREQIKKRLCPNLYEYYGLQECGALTVIKPDEKNRKPDSVGQVTFSCEVRLVDHQGRDAAPGEIGEIIARAPGSTAGYFKNEDKTAEAFKGGWFHTGDLGRFDEEGYLFLSGRGKDMIISGGQNVFAIEVEDMILRHPGVSDCAVIGLPHDAWGEMVTAVCVKAPGADVVEEDLIRHCKEKIAGFKVPKKIIWHDAPLPRTPTGKVTKFVLVDRYSQD
ncbi:MAG: AMP-binding protein [Pseudomonadota bacterium]